MNRSLFTKIAAGLPVLGLLLLIVQAQWAIQSGSSWRIPISGFDPRDLLYGQYLRYEFQFRHEGRDTCGPEFNNDYDGECCLCLTRGDPSGFDPATRTMSCAEARATCEAAIQAEAVRAPQQYLVPEDRGLDLERALREHDASIVISVPASGRPAIRELMLDGRPWRELLR